MHAIGFAVSLVLTVLLLIAYSLYLFALPWLRRLDLWYPAELEYFFWAYLGGLNSTFPMTTRGLLDIETVDLDYCLRRWYLILLSFQFCLGLCSLWYAFGATFTRFTEGYIVLGISTALLPLAWCFPVAYIIALYSFIRRLPLAEHVDSSIEEQAVKRHGLISRENSARHFPKTDYDALTEKQTVHQANSTDQSLPAYSDEIKRRSSVKHSPKSDRDLSNNAGFEPDITPATTNE